MDRVVVWCTLACVVGACGQASGGPADPASDDHYYALLFDEVLERGEAWWGYPPPEDYCVAIAPGYGEPSLEKSQDPSNAVLDSLARANPDKAFHPVSSCTDTYPAKAPTGEVAGLLWTAPLDMSDRATLSGGWTAQTDMTTWRCTFVETEEVVELQECSLSSET